MSTNRHNAPLKAPATGSRALMECGEFSPLFAGDSSPSEYGSFRSASRLLCWREPKRPRFAARIDDLDGDESPAESGDKSPHSKTRRTNASCSRTRMPFSLAPGFSRVWATATSGNRFNGLRHTWLALAILLALWGGGLPASSEIYETNGWKLDVRLHFDKPEFMLGEPTWFTCEVRNLSDTDLEVIVGGDYQNDVGRPDSFKIKFVGSDGRLVPQPMAHMLDGGITGPQKMPAKGSYTFRLFVPHWATFSEPGAYSVTCARRLDIGRAGGAFKLVGNQIISEPTTPVDVQVKGEVRVVAADFNKFGEVIESLGGKVFKGKWDEQEAAMKTLTSLNDERVVPILNKAAASGYTGWMMPAIGALGNFKSNEAFEGLKRAMNLTGKDIWNATRPELAAQSAQGMRHAAAVSLARGKHPEAIPFLLKLWNDDSEAVRITILHVLGKMDTVESLALLQEMSRDKSERVSNEAKRYFNLRTKQNERLPPKLF